MQIVADKFTYGFMYTQHIQYICNIHNIMHIYHIQNVIMSACNQYKILLTRYLIFLIQSL